ncbi:abscisic acid-deficient protein Aba4 family protein [Hyphococcus sp.]|uniref:abscisic acid-deficient protein Aba4 family protein n=1 Tax=Hyphococcus sp. TaxID=2038636 RepID=UPI003D13E535
MTLDIETLFALSSRLAMIGWLLLLFSPKRWEWVLFVAGIAIPALLSTLYGGLILAFFAGAEGGGFGSLAEVRALFANDAALLAGWVHYLAFDLAIGAMIARRADAAGVTRLVQIPILFFTFMFGPLGFLLFLLTEAGWRGVAKADGAAAKSGAAS